MTHGISNPAPCPGSATPALDRMCYGKYRRYLQICMRRLMIFLVLGTFLVGIQAPDQVVLGDHIQVVISVENPTNETVEVAVALVSPYNSTQSATLGPQASMDFNFTILTSNLRAGDVVNVTAIVYVYRSQGAESYTVHKDVEIIAGKPSFTTSVILAIALVTIGVSIMGYWAMARRRKEEEEEETFDRPPRL